MVDPAPLDDFLFREAVRFCFSLLATLFLVFVAQTVLRRRDRRVQELDRDRQLVQEVRNELVLVFNAYYAIRKRYSTVRQARAGEQSRNPYIAGLADRGDGILDALLVKCIDLEARYYSLMERLKVEFPQLWSSTLRPLMEREDRIDKGPKNNDALEFYFDRIRDRIEEQGSIDPDIKGGMTRRYGSVLEALNRHEGDLLAQLGKTVGVRRPA